MEAYKKILSSDVVRYSISFIIGFIIGRLV